MTRETFVVAGSNEIAVRAGATFVRSEEPLLVICGEAGVGKTHLARLLAEEASAPILRAVDLPDQFPSNGEFWFVDDVAVDLPPANMLSLIDGASANRGRLALIGRGDPAGWAGGLKDLETRLNGAPRIALVDPDEALLRAVMTKLFRDRQLNAPDAVVDYAAPRLRKTLAAAAAFVSAIDAASLERAKPIGLKLARSVIANLSEEPSAA